MRIIDGRVRLTASDLVNHLACRHLTRLDFGVASGEMEAPHFRDPAVEMLQQKGDAHERDYIEHLRESGHQVTSISGVGLDEDAVADTLQAMRDGHEIIEQASFVQGRWGGRADVLKRVPVPSDLGDWSYEVIDTKLARETKAGTVLQLSLYSDLVGRVQGALPEYMYVVTPWTGFAPQRYRTSDYSAYYRLIKARLESYFDADRLGDTYPDPRDHCRICRWREYCDGVRRDDDHISLVAGITEPQIAELRGQGVVRTTELADLTFPLPWVTRSATASRFAKLKEQARVQVESRVSGPVSGPLFSEGTETGLEGIPAPSPGDVFFAFERAPFAGPNGIHYLFGVLTTDESGASEYGCLWAMSGEEERLAFDSFVDLVEEEWERDPDMHVYHYGRSGPNAMMRLSGRHGTREAEIDGMICAGLFVDLYPVVRDGILASVEKYTLEELEPFYGFVRAVSRASAEEASRSISAAMELAYPGEVGDLAEDDSETVRGYNSDNCRSVQRLRDWLEGLREELEARGEQLGRPEVKRNGGSVPGTETQRLIERLQEGVPAEGSQRTKEQEALWIISNILNWHWKEETANWEEFARLADCSSEELMDENRALAQLERVDADESAWGHSVDLYRFPAQETSLSGGDDLYDRGGFKIGEIGYLDFRNCLVEVSFEYGEEGFIGGDVIGFADIPTDSLKESLRILGHRTVQHGTNGGGEFNLGWDLLSRNRPRTGGGPVCRPQETSKDAALRAARKADFGVLPVQGPPGSGKTYLGAEMICALFQQGFRVGITGNSHRVIRNLVDKVLEVACEKDIDLRAVHRTSGRDSGTSDPGLLLTRSYSSVLGCLKAERRVAAGTAWMWSRPEFQDKVDVLFVDEAAQMSLANVLASCRAARNLVLLGDPQQLDQPVRGNHPEGVDVSALGYILGGKATIDENEGLFLPTTYRLHPELCSFTSEAFYEGRLASQPGLEQQRVVSSGPVSGSGLRYVNVDHRGNRTSSSEEVETVARIVSGLVDGSSSWVDREGGESLLRWEDVLIVAPYNAQVQRVQERLPGANVGTVDKFQGQEAPVVIYSMATSDPAEAPRGMDFLYNLNRLNVATSRARCVCVLVGSPALFEPDCRTPREIHLANALCRYRELATEIRV